MQEHQRSLLIGALGGFLLELPHELYFPLDGLLNSLGRHGIFGILSHPERNLGLLKHPKRGGQPHPEEDLADAIVDPVLDRDRLLRLDGPSVRNQAPSRRRARRRRS